MSTWGPDGPPPEAYERVSDPERFRGLHRAGRELFDDLEATYVVVRESFLDHERPHGPEPAERLAPGTPGASPMALTYTEAPGLAVRWGRDLWTHLPICACDACDETHHSALEQLHQIAETVTAGTFGETLTLSQSRWEYRTWSATSDGARSDGYQQVDDDHAERLLARMPDGELTWQPWRRRDAGPGT